MNCKKKRMCAIILALLLAFSVTGCTSADTKGNSVSSGESASTVKSTSVSVVNRNSDELFSDRDKEIGYDESTANKIVLSDTEKTVTINTEGTYLISGSSANGQIVVDAKKTDKIQLVLCGVNLNCNTSAAIYVKQADKVFITLASGTQNTLSNQSEFVAIDDSNIDSVIFSKSDLTLNGAGMLVINAAYGHGIVSKDDLAITSGSYQITVQNHALSANDSVRIADGSFTLSSGKDGIHAENTEDTALGFVYLAGGDFTVTSGGDGISASADLQVDAGTFQIVSGGGSQNAAVKQEEMQRPGKPAEQQPVSEMPAAEAAEMDTISTKGIKATGNLTVNGGVITIDSADDSLHSNANLVIKDGTLTLSSGDDGVHADANTAINGGTLTVAKSYEGIEGKSIDITGGSLSVVASDDGINAAGGNDQSGFGGMGKDSFAADESCYIKISGGKVHVNASGDGIDSNGNLYVTGGETIVSGPTNSGNGALDYNGEGQITGGTLVAVGAAGMAQNFGDSSTQGTILVNLTDTQANATLALKDSAGNELVSCTPEKPYSSVVISCPDVKAGESYTLETGAIHTSIAMTSLVYGAGGGMGGQPGGMGRPGGDRGTPPSGETKKPSEMGELNFGEE